MSTLDWCVVSIYAVGMLAIGWYYSRRTADAESYLLGGRTMNPIALGLSLFATMLSAITYLALPGEVIENGPIFIIGKIAAFPLIWIVVGWAIIPFLMKLRVVSAYELLEERLGLSVRIVGATFFLSLRLMWMSVVLYATSDKVLVPLLGLSDQWWAVPCSCLILGVITVTYTSMGGLKAVVLSDVIQSVVLLGGVLLTLAAITYSFGGFSWWPTTWPEHWSDPHWVWPPGARTTFIGALIANFTWFVCTSGSDQMAVQRFLAGRDAAAARRTLAASLVVSAFAGAMLSIVGLALMSYVTRASNATGGAVNAWSDADRVFPAFIAQNLPNGISGLVIAGVIAAAMSSLSSGVNSCCSVVVTDFIDRFGIRRNAEAGQLTLERYTSAIVGCVVVFLSTFVGMFEGNLLTLAFKVCNMLTAPLFGLFLLAWIAPRATVLGTHIGTVAGLMTVVAVSFYKDFTGNNGISYLWAMPLGLLVQVVVGVLASWILWKPRRSNK